MNDIIKIVGNILEKKGFSPGEMPRFDIRKRYKDGEPCGHPNCLRHLSHPCEVCGRIGGREIK